MKEIKFRMWHKTKNKMYKVGILDFENKLAYVENHKLYFPFDEIVITQYTGLKDKNGTKIYENDIIKHKGLHWVYANSRIEYIENKGLMRVGHTPVSFIEEDKNIIEDFEIVGNIYENPEYYKLF